MLEFLTNHGLLPNNLALLPRLAVVTSNAIGSVPTAMLLLQLWPTPPPGVLYALALLSTLAGNLLLTGSLTNVLIAERADRMGARLTFAEYARAGIPITVLSLAFATFWLALTRHLAAAAADPAADSRRYAWNAGGVEQRVRTDRRQRVDPARFASAPAAARWRCTRPRWCATGCARPIPNSPPTGRIELVPIRTTGDRVQTACSPRSAARASSPRRSRRRCSTGVSTSPCIR